MKWQEVRHGHPTTWNCAAVCGACGGVICFEARNSQNHQGVSPSQAGGNIEPAWIVGAIWPDQPPSRAPAHTPPPVARRFVQGENAYRRGDWNAAVAMYRSALDIATKGMEGVPDGLFYPRLQWLHDQHLITPQMFEWATQVRVEGNASLHDPEEFVEEDAKPLRLFSETFLRYVYELPGEVSAYSGDSESDA